MTTTRWPPPPMSPAFSPSPIITMGSSPPSRWIASRPSPAPPTATRFRPPSTAIRPGFCICPWCAMTSSTARSALRPSTGGWDRRSATLPVRSLSSTPATWAESTFTPISPCPLPPAAGAWCPEAALRETYYSISQNPDLTGMNGRHPHHQPRLARPRRRGGGRGHPAPGHRARLCSSRLPPRAAPRHRA